MLALLSPTVRSLCWWPRHGYVQFTIMNSAPGLKSTTAGSITNWNSSGVSGFPFFFLLACEKVGFVLLKCVHRPHFLFLFSIKQRNPEALFFFPPSPLNFALLSSLYCKYDFRKWCVILASFMSGSPKQGVTDVHRELNVCAMVAEMVMANYTWTSFTSWPFNFSC